MFASTTIYLVHDALKLEPPSQVLLQGVLVQRFFVDHRVAAALVARGCARCSRKWRRRRGWRRGGDGDGVGGQSCLALQLLWWKQLGLLMLTFPCWHARAPVLLRASGGGADAWAQAHGRSMHMQMQIWHWYDSTAVL